MNYHVFAFLSSILLTTCFLIRGGISTASENSEESIEIGGEVSRTDDGPVPNMQVMPRSCEDLLRIGRRRSGLSTIWPSGDLFRGVLRVYCDQETDGGGWTLIQRRGDYGRPVDYFYKSWQEYEDGFGRMDQDFWLGNRNIATLTEDTTQMIRIELGDWTGNEAVATYESFWVDRADDYRVHLGNFTSGSAGDSFAIHDGMQFSAKDRDNDNNSTINCAVFYQSGWWFNSCYEANLNGLYVRGGEAESFPGSVEWEAFRGLGYSLKNTVMKIRSINFRP